MKRLLLAAALALASLAPASSVAEAGATRCRHYVGNFYAYSYADWTSANHKVHRVRTLTKIGPWVTGGASSFIYNQSGWVWCEMRDLG